MKKGTAAQLAHWARLTSGFYRTRKTFKKIGDFHRGKPKSTRHRARISKALRDPERFSKRETVLERRVVRYARVRGWLVLKQDARFHKGIPDRLFVTKSGHVWIEFKRPDGTGKVSIHQKKFHKILRRLGQNVEVVSDYQEAIRILQAA